MRDDENDFARYREKFDRFDRRRQRPINGRDKDFNRDAKPVVESENPLALRRNEAALKSIQGKRPSLVGEDGKIMRSRRGWKRDDSDKD